MILNFKTENGYETIINMDNVLYILARHDGGYLIMFRDKNEVNLTWKEFDNLTKALKEHGN